MTCFQELARTFESLRTELEHTHGVVLRGIVIMDMRRTLDAMWGERWKYNLPADDLQEKEAYLQHAS